MMIFGIMTAGMTTTGDSKSIPDDKAPSRLSRDVFFRNRALKKIISHLYSRNSMIQTATTKDIPALVSLLNSAYRGESSKMGWTTEADMISGSIRTDETQLRELMEKPGAVFLKSVNDKEEIEGCVYLDKRKGKLYLGMLSVNPAIQARGTGRMIMAAAEDHARKEGCPAIYMRVISLRHELIAWYEKQGYFRTGETEPFENSPYGTALVPFEFLVMEKRL